MFYQVFKETIYGKFIGDYESYGIIYGNNFIVHDVSLSFDNLNSFVGELNYFKVSPQSIKENYLIEEFVLEDY